MVRLIPAPTGWQPPGRLGFYADDGGWLVRVSAIRPGQMWDVMRHYLPGRNLHPLWHYLVYQMVGDPFGQSPLLHLIQSALDGLVVAAFFLLLRLLGLPGFAAWTAAGLFAFWPFHGETHFWLEAMPMNLLSTLWLLGAIATSVMLLRRPLRLVGRGPRLRSLWMCPVHLRPGTAAARGTPGNKNFCDAPVTGPLGASA